VLDEPTNHLDLDSKDVLLEALEDFGGTLIFVSHDRYFVDKLATKVIEIGNGHALIYPGTYEEFLWSRRQAEAPAPAAAAPRANAAKPAPTPSPAAQPQIRAGSNGRGRHSAQAATARPASPPAATDKASAQQSYDDRRRDEAEARRMKKAADAQRKRVDELEARIADRERAIKELESTMSAPGFYDNREASQPVISKHQALMWEVGDLMNQWESLQTKS